MAKHIVHQFFVGPGPSGEMAVGLAWAEHGWQPNVDVYETPDSLLLAVEIPGVDENEINLHFIPGTTPHLIIEGRRDAPDFLGPARCLQVEIEHGPFRRQVRLPRDADGDSISARRENGLLRITIPKNRPQPSQHVKVTVN